MAVSKEQSAKILALFQDMLIKTGRRTPSDFREDRLRNEFGISESFCGKI